VESGALAGGAIGGIAASNVGGGKMSLVSAIVGAVAGGIVGDKIEKNVNTLNGQEITIRLSNDTLIVVTQEIDKNVGPLRAGDKVRVLTSSNGTTRVQLNQ
jgi:outer membrane lipoprotein SlyB